jgi:hypothetical protein
MNARHVSYKGFQFYVPESYEESASLGEVGMQYWFDHSLRSTLTYAEQIWHVNSHITEMNLSILEVFCGFGMSTVTIDSSRIEKHVAFDHSEACCEAFQFLRPDADVIITDSYVAATIATKLYQFDCVYLEYSAMTTFRAFQDPNELALIEGVLNSEPRYVIFVDSAKVKEHLHRATYSKFFDFGIDSSDGYVRAVEYYFLTNYGYRMAACAHDGINYTYLLKRSPNMVPCEIVDTRQLVQLDQFKDLGYVEI